MRLAPLAILAAGLLLGTQGCLAADTYGFAAAGVDATAEAGIGLSFNDHLALRASAGHSQMPDDTKQAGGISYRTRPDGNTTASVIADWFPFAQSGFRASGGLRYQSGNGEALAGQAGPDGSYAIGGHAYSAAQVGVLSGRLQYDKLQPYLGVGWDSAPPNKPGWRFMADMGVNIQTLHRVSLSSSAGQDDNLLQQDIAAARQQLTHEYGGTRWRLAATVGVAYSF